MWIETQKQEAIAKTQYIAIKVENIIAIEPDRDNTLVYLSSGERITIKIPYNKALRTICGKTVDLTKWNL